MSRRNHFITSIPSSRHSLCFSVYSGGQTRTTKPLREARITCHKRSAYVRFGGYLIWSGQARPRLHSWWFAWWVLNVYGAAVAVLDFLSGTNFMYLRQKPTSSSLFDILGPWPWYILGADLVALVFFRLMQLSFSSRTEAISS